MRLLRTTLCACLVASCAQGESGDARRPPRPTLEQTERPGADVPAAEIPHPGPVARAPDPSSGGSGGGGGDPGGEGGGAAGGSGGAATTDIQLVDVRAPLGADEDGERSPSYTGLGAGVALVDLDGDADLDLLVSAELNPLHAFRNEGSFRFRDATGQLGLPEIRSSAAFALGDCDGDGALEILVSRSDPTVLLRREGGAWLPVEDAGLGDVSQHGLSAAFEDIDGDGDLDVFQAIYMPDDHRFVGTPPRVYFNDGTCHFERRDGIGLEPGMGIDFGFLDADEDGDPDVLVSNDFGMLNGAVRFYENTGGAFRAVASPEGLLFGMGATVADLDVDGRLDVFVANIGRNPWYRNTGGLALVDASGQTPLGPTWYVDPEDTPKTLPYYDPDSPDPTERRMAQFVRAYLPGRPDDEHAMAATTWSASAVDLDADGWLDLFLTRGPAGIGFVPEGRYQRLGLLQGGPDGYRDVSAAVGFDFWGTFKGSTVGDLDGDGLPDLVVFDHRFSNPAPRHRIFRNATGAAGRWLRVELQGRPPNTWGIGAVVEVELPDHRVVQRRTLHQGVYSASADAMFFGIGAQDSADVKVTWPWGGGVTVVREVPAGTTARIRQAAP